MQYICNRISNIFSVVIFVKLYNILGFNIASWNSIFFSLQCLSWKTADKLYSKHLIPRLLLCYWLSAQLIVVLSVLNSAFKYWLESNIKEHLKRKGGVLTVCMAASLLDGHAHATALLLFMANTESFGQWAAVRYFSSASGKCFHFSWPSLQRFKIISAQ